jgi:hypothetical protein
MELHYPASRRRSIMLLLQHGKSWPRFFFWGGGGVAEEVNLVDIMQRGQTINLGLYIHTLKTLLKSFSKVQPHKSVVKSSLDMTVHDHTTVWKYRKQSQNTPCSPDHAVSDFHLFGVLKDIIYG